uniref:Uncharacterized protein n=1 Tax=Pyxicephalus adspersus TaxID=30357 RepID=A0AAV3B8V1_PYXAD|nr:TPA: hypothetical protein GDO54_000189 [Pyxicephalus adspersus]
MYRFTSMCHQKMVSFPQLQLIFTLQTMCWRTLRAKICCTSIYVYSTTLSCGRTMDGNQSEGRVNLQEKAKVNGWSWELRGKGLVLGVPENCKTTLHVLIYGQAPTMMRWRTICRWKTSSL